MPFTSVYMCFFIINIAKFYSWVVLLGKEYVRGYCCYSTTLSSSHSHPCGLIYNNWSSNVDQEFW